MSDGEALSEGPVDGPCELVGSGVIDGFPDGVALRLGGFVSVGPKDVDGATEGTGVGNRDGEGDGSDISASVGSFVGEAVGMFVG